jgi:hypothetical protein
MVNTPGRSIKEKTAKTSGGSFVSLSGTSTVYGSNHRSLLARLANLNLEITPDAVGNYT